MSKHLRGVKPAIRPDQEPMTRMPRVPAWFSAYELDLDAGSGGGNNVEIKNWIVEGISARSRSMCPILS